MQDRRFILQKASKETKEGNADETGGRKEIQNAISVDANEVKTKAFCFFRFLCLPSVHFVFAFLCDLGVLVFKQSFAFPLLARREKFLGKNVVKIDLLGILKPIKSRGDLS